MTMTLSTLPPSAAAATLARDADATPPVAGPPAATHTSPADRDGGGNFERALLAVQWRDDAPPSPVLSTTPTDAQRSAEDARAALSAALLTPIVSVPVGAPTGQAPHVRATDAEGEGTGDEPALTDMLAPGAQLNAMLFDTPQRATVMHPPSGAASGAKLEPAQAWTPAGAPATTPASQRTAIVIGTASERHPEVDAPSAPTGDLASWRDVLSAERHTTANATPPLKLPANAPSQWREPLLNTLGERVQWHTQRGNEQAVIRLDPPSLGRVDIVIKQDGGLMHVHLSATHREVVQQLQGLSDQLRHDLAGRHSGDVAVHVSEQPRDGDGRQRGRQGNPDEQQGRPGRALTESDESQASLRTFSLQTPER